MLYLSRLSKAFRTFFTSRSTQFIWTAARENVPELPPLPEDLNEMQYASLLYDTHCHVRVTLLFPVRDLYRACPAMHVEELPFRVLGMPNQTLQTMLPRIVRRLAFPFCPSSRGLFTSHLLI